MITPKTGFVVLKFRVKLILKLKKKHKDRFPSANKEEKQDAEEKFKSIGEAYAVLMDESKRKLYDNIGNNNNRDCDCGHCDNSDEDGDNNDECYYYY